MLKLEARPQPSGFWRIASPLLALVLTVVIGVMLFLALGKDPVQGLRVFFWEPIRSSYALGELVVKATPLLIIALGLALCFRSNVWNIGAEGQYVMGAVFATGIALMADKASSPWVMVPLVLLAGVLGGMVWAGITAFLRDRFHANEILVSLMLVYVAIMVLGYLVYGPWKDPLGYNFPQTKTVEAARYAGFSSSRAIWLALLVSGGAAGLAGALEVAGPIGQLTPYVPVGYGFAAIIVAFVGRLHPVGMVFSAILMSMFYIGGELAQSRLGLPKSLTGVFQGLLLFSLLACDVLMNYRLRWAPKRVEVA